MIYKIIIIALFSLLLTACGNNNISENDTSTDNNLYSRFPYNLICKIKKIGLKCLYDGKELKVENEKELNIEI